MSNKTRFTLEFELDDSGLHMIGGKDVPFEFGYSPDVRIFIMSEEEIQMMMQRLLKNDNNE